MWSWMTRWFGTKKAASAPPSVVAEDLPRAASSKPAVPLDKLDALFLAVALPDSALRGGGAGPDPERALQDLTEQCAPERFDPQRFPRLPAILPELLGLLRSEQASSRQLAKLVERDPALLGEVVRIANSAYYGAPRQIGTLAQAIVLIGDEGLRRLVVRALARPIHDGARGIAFRVAGPHFAALSESCGRLCAVRYRGTEDPFEAYLAGTFRHAGAMMVVRRLDEVPELRASRRAADFAERFMALDAALSLRAAQHWEFPPRVIAALAEAAGAEPQAEASALSMALAQADREAKAAALDSMGERGAVNPRVARDTLAVPHRTVTGH